MYNIAKKALWEAAADSGISVEFKDYPPNRAGMLFDNGDVDGFLFSDIDFEKQHPGAVRVAEPLGVDEIAVMTVGPVFRVNGWSSLKPYRIGYLHGMLVVENNLRGMRTDGANDALQVFEKLKVGRIDLIVLPRYLHDAYESRFPEVRVLEPPLERVELFVFLTAKNAALAPLLADSLANMKKSGRFAEIVAQAKTERR